MRTRFIAIVTGIAITSIVPGVVVFAQVPSKNAAETGFTRQIQTRPALFQQAREIDTTFNAQVGERLIKPMAISARSAHEPDISCNFSCSAFIPRQAVLDLEWEEAPSATASVSADGSTEHRTLRLDISGTATGFQRESYGTVKLDQIPATLSKHAQTNISCSAASIAIAPSPVLLRFVEAGRIVKRASNLPVFRSVNALNESMSESILPEAVRQAIQRDQMTGSLGQVRLMSKSVETRQDKPRRTVTMEGLQPALSYRFRVVEERVDSAITIAQKICHVPTCPADFIDVP